ncbi:hypothetical protein DFR65_101103 [Oceanihabitans sediminis]|uniref:XRE family transcriptional regulator n=1 Tax=Oceanihabitans sediminis TaxID=1812012 RepID=A0A368P6I8_9FLAO|nr:helix-turn-helix transcriptional regulator [Oceanihabitans sediminis]RBP34220.1 hypothetical protein DFR65_101103 [Oceanihabitans sediminis]RCU57910.1 XRE family transcriptional regulator [Oceanihabitans sediminis]
MKEEVNENDSKILKNVINALGLKQHSLSLKLGYKSPASVYHVVNGVNSLSSGMKERIVQVFPNVSMSYLSSGEGPVLLTGEDLKTQINILNVQSDPEVEFIKRIADIPNRLDKIERMLKELMEDKGKDFN